MKNVLLLLVFIASVARSQDIAIIPQPLKLQQGKGTFQLTPQTVIVVSDASNQPSADFLNAYLQQVFGFQLKIVPKASNNFIRLNNLVFIKAPDNEERYSLSVDTKGISIQGDAQKGTFYGVQTLIQLLPAEKNRNEKKITQLLIPHVNIEDQPRFAYRGMHLDVSRHFFPVAFLKKYIDYLALHKLNTFHWHLTDDQGWRIEIKKYPRLTTTGGWRNGTIIGRYPGKGNDSIRYGGFYTQEEVKEIVAYAARRFITVIPEIEMPGHASAAIAAYPELSCFPEEDTKVAKGTAWAGPTRGKQVQQAWGVFEDVFCAGKENTFTILQDILTEVMALFPSRYIHIGGDECPKTSWERCTLCQQRMKENKLKDAHELQSYFIQRMEKFINNNGKQIIGWDEILEGGLAPNASVMSWRGEQGGIMAAKQNHDVVMTPGGWCYFDHSQSRNEDSITFGGFTPVEKVYQYNPVPKQLNETEARHILGAQANLWTEYITNTRKIEYQLFPRLAALSEVLWTHPDRKDSADFEKRLLTQFKRYDSWKANYSKAFWGLNTIIGPAKDFNGLLITATTKQKNFRVTFNVNNNNRVYTQQPLLLTESAVVTAIGPFQTTQQFQFFFNKATGKNCTVTPAPSTTYAGNSGAFGLVNGIRASRFASPEWLGWNGKIPEITIDLGKADTLRQVVLHVWKQEASWIYLPEKIEVSFPGTNTAAITFDRPANGWPNDAALQLNIPATFTRYMHIKVTPLMKIPSGNPGAGNAAWVFIDEVEMN